MQTKTAVERRVETYRGYLLAALEERVALDKPDQQLDLLILTLIDKLEALLWVLGALDDDVLPSAPGQLH